MTTDKGRSRELKTELQKDAETETKRNKEGEKKKKKTIENPNNCKLSIPPTVTLRNLSSIVSTPFAHQHKIHLANSLLVRLLSDP